MKKTIKKDEQKETEGNVQGSVLGGVHKTVLLKETIDGLNLSGNEIVLDATFGGGGHAKEALNRFPKIKCIALDQDIDAWRRFENKSLDISFHNLNFRYLDEALKKEEVRQVDGVIFDFGLSSDQFETSGRGFSFMKNEPLFMTMKENPSSEDLTAEDVVNDWSEESLTKIIFGYGEEKFARRIARGIVQAREKGRLKNTFDLVQAIEESVPAIYKKGRLHFATRTFQAIRIAVNDELGAISEALPKAFDALKREGRMSVISFHSLEDRIVKRFFKKMAEDGLAKIITKKPLSASEIELKENPRARSAKLRIIEKI
ncbi:MAG: 16S rRNA (cytosine(1402)-N(4))-methyltransferase RsmH [Candidatus Pacebacteria bacterium]|nr:16S rRNA (cytosine(1402)-N(4))-methyltransferase RsmH [Candidatus Paceibacterota bacterium]MCF7863031.1 16S rRNA (cytosine(1402)-N(4))-methyltransferase RsmH [Candidatus Paceibacterota bacterium]